MYPSIHARPLCDFIKNAPTPFHAVDAVRRRLLAEGYRLRREGDPTPHEEGGRYVVIRSDSSLVAYRYHASARGFRISAAHTDTPGFRLKPVAERTAAGSYTVSIRPEDTIDPSNGANETTNATGPRSRQLPRH